MTAAEAAKRMLRVLHWPARLLSWAIIAFAAVTILAHSGNLWSLAGVNETARSLCFSVPPTSRDLAAAGVTADEILQAVATPADAILPQGVKLIPLTHVAAIRPHASAARRPCLLFCYCSMKQPVFTSPRQHRKFTYNNSGAAALALRKALQGFGDDLPFDVYACRVARIAPIPPATHTHLANALGVEPRECKMRGYGFFAFINANGQTQATASLPAGPQLRHVLRDICAFRSWLRRQCRATAVSHHSETPSTCTPRTPARPAPGEDP